MCVCVCVYICPQVICRASVGGRRKEEEEEEEGEQAVLWERGGAAAFVIRNHDWGLETIRARAARPGQ